MILFAESWNPMMSLSILLKDIANIQEQEMKIWWKQLRWLIRLLVQNKVNDSQSISKI